MPTDQRVTVEAGSGLLQIQSAAFAEGQAWQVRAIGRQRLLVESEAAALAMRGDQAGAGRLSHAVFVSLLYGLVAQKFDGLMSVDLGDSVKRLYFRSGELVFAASNLIDDRLGEVIYRAGQITLDQLTEAAVQVNRTTKFGRVLLESRVFSSSQLWDALKLQVTSIFQSTFLYDHVYVQLEPGQHLSPTAVAIDEPTVTLIDDCLGYADLYRQFRLRLDNSCKMAAVDFVLERIGAKPGTFIGDTVELVNAHPSIEGFLEHSKLTEANSLCALFDLLNHHIIRIEGYDTSTRTLDTGAAVKQIRSLIDAYHLIIDGAKKAFTAEGLEFPVLDIELFLDQQYSFRRSPVFVLQNGTIAPEAIVSIFTKARTSARQAEVMANQMQGLILFLLQVIGDLLPSGKGWELKRSFQNLVT
ncbi:DUF4388 domain-containing protein [Oligoflexus tunisiensis]|uniref:DUF4388 domain-containing protein n=1 Tax=Oligoflexus tunisiensis TaxID=708132 RepID=UPI00114D1136|nr:DUF4388 domain-containing protein [Oligoflexus tunisiensis]